MPFDPATLLSRTPAGDAELRSPQNGLSLGQRKLLSYLDQPQAFDELSAERNLDPEKLERDLRRLAATGLVLINGETAEAAAARASASSASRAPATRPAPAAAPSGAQTGAPTRPNVPQASTARAATTQGLPNRAASASTNQASPAGVVIGGARSPMLLRGIVVLVLVIGAIGTWFAMSGRRSANDAVPPLASASPESTAPAATPASPASLAPPATPPSPLAASGTVTTPASFTTRSDGASGAAPAAATVPPVTPAASPSTASAGNAVATPGLMATSAPIPARERPQGAASAAPTAAPAGAAGTTPTSTPTATAAARGAPGSPASAPAAPAATAPTAAAAAPAGNTARGDSANAAPPTVPAGRASPAASATVAANPVSTSGGTPVPAPDAAPAASAPAAAEAPVRLAMAAPSAAEAHPANVRLTPLTREDPSFPREALSRGVTSGNVRARVAVDAAGKVTGVTIVESRPSTLFDRAVRDALSRWTFAPGDANRSTEVEIAFRRD